MHVKPFDQINKNDVDLAGGKGASLGEMTQAGIPVPPGYVVLAPAFDAFLDETKLRTEIDSVLHNVNHEVVHSVNQASETIRALIEQADMSEELQGAILEFFDGLDTEYVAVRSSATSEDSADAAWAGQLETYLNTTRDQLITKVKKCWSSLFTPRAIFYRFEKGLHGTPISVAVVVQKMVNSEKSGIAFSVHPVTQDHNQLIIEAGLGLGEAVVSGEITPDSYVVEKDIRNIIESLVNEQTKMLVRDNTGGNKWVDLGAIGNEAVLSHEDVLKLSELIMHIESHYKFPVDIEWAYAERTFYITQSRPITTLGGMSGTSSSEPEESLSLYRQAGSPIGLYQIALPMITCTKPMTQYFNASYGDLWVYFKEDHITNLIQLPNMEAVSKEFFEKARNGELDAWKKEWAQITKEMNTRSREVSQLALEELSIEELKDAYQTMFALDQRMWAISIFIDALDPGFDQEEILKIQQEHGLSDEDRDILLAPTTPAYITTFENDLVEYKEGAVSLEEMIQRYFWIGADYGVFEEVDKQWLDQRASEAQRHEFVSLEPKQTQILKRLNLTENPLETFKYLGLWRDDRKILNFQGVYGCVRLLREALRRQGIDPKCVNALKIEEVDAAFSGGLTQEQLEQRNKDGVLYQVHEDGSITSIEGLEAEKEFNRLSAFLPTADTDIIKGSIACPGKVVGRVCLAKTPDDPNATNMKDGDILVTSMTRPEFVPLMRLAGAIVTDEGGISSHAAIVSREMNTPCVIGTKVATQALKNGDLVEVDADNGVVRLIERGASAEKPKGALREYTVLGITPIFRALVSQSFSDFFHGESLTDITYVVRNEEFYHFQREKEVRKLGEAFLRRVVQDNVNLDELYKQFDERVSVIDKIYAYSVEDLDVQVIEQFFEMYTSTLNEAYAAAYAMDFLDVIDADKRAACEEWILKTRMRAEHIYKKGEMEFVPRICEWFGKKFAPAYETALLAYLTDEELLRVVKQGAQLPTVEELQARKKMFYAKFLPVEQQEFLTGEAAAKRVEEEALFLELDKTYDDVTRLEGQVAYGGKATGKVHIMRKRSDMESFNDGDIIVSPMTDPSFLPAMKRAAAFVTDEGGTLCHAAIVARELQKPCVIGTKVATQALRNDDLVEVDADKGVVRLIERSNDAPSSPGKNWKYYLSRPFTLLGASLWNLWYSSDQMKEVIGTNMPEAVFVEMEKGFVRSYRNSKEFANLENAFADLVTDLEVFRQCLDKAEYSNKRLEEIITQNETLPLKEALSFMIENALYATIIPYWGFHALEKGEIPADIKERCESLRGVRNYPRVLEHVIMPAISEIAPNHGDMLTIQEILSGVTEPSAKRKEDLSSQAFVLKYQNGKEILEFTQSPKKIVEELEPSMMANKTLTGTIANKGHVTGTVRHFDLGENPDFNEGDIVVATSTDPNLMPYLKKCGAIVTDEGGMMCHAAIVARELNKPCVIGTKFATQVLKEGTKVEVNANEGWVKPIQRKWKKIVTRKNSPLFLNFICTGVSRPYTKNVLGVDLGYEDYVFVDDTVYTTEEASDDVKKRFTQFIEDEDVAGLERLLGIWEKAMDELLIDASQAKDFVGKSEQEIMNYFSSISEKYFTLSTALMLVLPIEAYFETKIKAILDKQSVKEDDAIFILTSPDKKNAVELETESLMNIAKEMKASGVTVETLTDQISKQIEKHIEEFGWINADRFFKEAWSTGDVLERLVGVERATSFTKTDNSERNLLATLELTKDEQEIIALAKKYVFFRTARMDAFIKAGYLLRPLLIDLSEKLSLNFKEVIAMTPNEVTEALLDQSSLQKRVLKDRLDSYGYVINGSKINTISGEELEAFKLENVFENGSDQSSVVSGQAAYPGKVQGEVRIVGSVHDLHRVKRGDVLVASMTLPSFIMAMERASAFVTDEGGILCHAAIVSREMKKPCIIGTSNATRVLKDGDIVEVNADNGAVRVIQEKQDEYIFMWGTAPIMPAFWAPPMIFFSDSAIWPKSTIFSYFNGEVINSYMLKEEIERQKREEGDQYLDPAHYAAYVERYEAEAQTWWEWIRDIEQRDFSSATREELQKEIHTFCLYQRDAINYFGSTRPEFTYAAEQQLEAMLKEVVGDNWAQAFGTLTSSVLKDDIQRELDDWKQTEKENAEALLAHASKYPWLVFGQFDDKKVVEFLQRREIDVAHAEQNLSAQQEELFNALKDNGEQARYLSRYLQEQSVRRMDIKSYWVGSYFLGRNLWKAIAQTLNIELWDLLKYVTPPEIESLLAGELTSIEEELVKRREAYAIIYEPGFSEIKIVSGEQATKEFEQRIVPPDKNVKELKGQTASVGVYRGKVRKALAGDLDELQKSINVFQKGEILVTSMTQPNMMVLANKAGAIIADEGGITSHAAIIARELNIPCIVGCQVAMEVLEDGDEIEVNATTGVINILNA